MGLFERFRRPKTETREVTVLDYPRFGESWRVDLFDDRAMARAAAEQNIQVEPGEHTDDETSYVVLQRRGPHDVVVTLGSQIIGAAPAGEVERVARRLQRGKESIVAAHARFYLHTHEQIGCGLDVWTVIVYA